MKKELSMDMLLTELNNNSLTNGEKAEILTTIIDLESEKPDGDMDLIRECLDFLAYLNGEESVTDEEQRTERLQRIYRKAADGEGKGAEEGKKRPVGRRRRLRKAAIVAAIIAGILLVAMTSLTVIARVNGYDSTWEWIADHWGEYLKLGHGEQTTIDGITIIREKDTKIYPDIESWLKEENLGILYPSVLPGDIKIDEIIENTRGEGEVSITLVFNTPAINFNAQNYDLSYFETHEEDMEVIELNGYRFGILYIPELESAYNAYYTVDGFAYFIGCQDRDTLLFMLENLKKPGS